jgi:hypothetical protein
MKKSVVMWALVGAAMVGSLALGAYGANGSVASATQPSTWVTFHNDFYWTDTDGARILTRSGCLRQFNGVFYWYGGNPRGFREQYVYTSTDLVHWTNKGVIFRQDFDANRIDVLYNDSTKQYVMFFKYNGNGAHFAVATSPTPDGQFTFKSQTLVDNALMGDMSIYEDDDGKAYLAHVSWAVGTNAQHGIYALSADYLTLDHRVYLWDIRSREAPHIFKKDGLYYYGTSRTAGIQSSGTSYYTATKLEGPWTSPKPLPTPGSTNSWDSQVDFVYPFTGSKGTVYMFAGDRWTKDLPKGRNGDYLWLPMEFEGADPTVPYYQDWDLNVAEGTWRKFDPARNLAAGKAATASSESAGHAASNVTAVKTYEDYIGHEWESAPSDSQWVQVDLGAAADVNRVILKWGNTAGKAFKIEVSTDGTAWKDVFETKKGSSYTVTDETFPTVSARYVRMEGTMRAAAPAGFGRRFRGARGGGATSAPATAPAFVPATAPAPGGYMLFDFEVLKD